MSDEGFDNYTLEFGGGESDRETMAFSQSNKRIREMPIDRLSELPDFLLIHILSFLFMKEAGRTSVLSKRWKFLWAELPTLEFRETLESAKTLNFVSWVNRTLDIRKGNNLKEFLVDFTFYDERFASDVDAWVLFCVKNEVKEFAFMMLPFDSYYRPPQVMYSCSSLTNLHLSRCIMSSQGTIKWQFLTKLFLDDVGLNQRLIDDILSSCPLLFDLSLVGCWGFSLLEVDSRCLSRLTIEESCYQPFLEISAPYVHDLDIKVSLQESKCRIKNMSSVVSASIDFFEYYGGHSVEMMSNADEFLENFRHVKKLWVAQPCFQVLSIMAMNGWQFPQLRLQDLTLVSCSEYEHSIPGIIGLLESSPNLETLLLEGFDTEGILFNLDPAAKGDLDSDLLHLKKIRVENFADSNGEPLLTLARILLKRATVLEEMMIVIDVEDTNDYVNIAQTLLTYPRSSTKAEIYLISHK